jgi:type IV pilus assembly protein PilM
LQDGWRIILAKNDEISSTERLLDLIREDAKAENTESGFAAKRSFTNRFKDVFSNSISLKKAVTVGVDLGHDDIKLVKIDRISNQKYQILDYAWIPFNPDTPRESPQFYQFLEPVLADFCGRSKNIDIWCTIPSARVETRLIRIPKVSPKQISNSVYWTYRKAASFDERDTLFDFELLGAVEDGDAPKIDVMAYTAPQSEIKELRDLFSRAGFPLTGISIVPFAFQSMLRADRIETEVPHISSLYIGRDWSRIDIFSDGNLMLSRGIKAGVKTMIEALRAEIEDNLFERTLEKSPTKDPTRIKAIRNKLKSELDQAQLLFFGGIHNAPPPPAEGQLLLKEDKIFQMILPALERLVRQVERTLRHFSLNYENARVGKIYISSGVNPHRSIVDYISNELAIPTEIVNPFAESANFSTMVQGPDSLSEQSSFAPAMGMALSSNAVTPNFLYTYKDKQKAIRSQRINRSVFAGFAVLMAVCVGLAGWQGRLQEEKEYQKRQLQQQLERVAVRVDKNLILKLVDDARTNNQQIKETGRKYFGLAVIGEIADLTPANVRLFSIAVKLEDIPENIKEDKKAEKKRTLTLDGIIQGDRLTLESTLAGYLMELKNSPLFDQPAIKKKSFDFYEEKEVLRFTALLTLT